MRKLSLVFALGVVLVLGAVGGLSTASQARADGPPNVRTIWIYRSSFTPSMSQEGSGVVVTLVNQDTIPHRIVLYRASTPQSFDVTIQPGEWYTVPQPLTCDAGCYSASYTFRDANLSYVYGGYCYSFCARVYVYNTGA